MEKAFTISSILTARRDDPLRVIIYGAPGVGKTSAAAHFPGPVLLRTEDGAAAIDVPTFPMVKSLENLSEALGALLYEDHDFKTLIIDSLDWLEPLVWAAVCEENDKKTIEAFGFNHGYKAALDKWKNIFKAFDALRIKKGMNIVLTAHADMKKIDPPDDPPFMMYDLKLNSLASNYITEWADFMFYLAIEREVVAPNSKQGTKGKATTTGARVASSGASASYKAKSRRAIPAQIYCGPDYAELIGALFDSKTEGAQL